MHQPNYQKLQQRAKIIQAIREFFWQQHFLEVETPQLVPLPSLEPYLEVFETKLLDGDSGTEHRAFLTSSPEYAMKKMLATGSGDLFQICKSYRNGEGLSSRHNPEFTILEWYRVETDYTAIMNDCENLVRFIGKKMGLEKLRYLEYEYDLAKPWERISVLEAFAKYARLDRDSVLDHKKLVKAAKQAGYQTNWRTSWEEAFNQIFLNEVEPHLGTDQPTILYDYPVAQAALARRKPGDPQLAERFEFYLGGLEIGNAFSELNDWQEQLARLQEDLAEKKRLGRTVFDIDPEFIEALKLGLPDCAGIAVGVDRLVMLFTNSANIEEVISFPARRMWGGE